MLTAKQYARIQPIMCNKYTMCKGCPLAEYSKKNGFKNCMIARVVDTSACVDLVEKWWEENSEFVLNKYSFIKERRVAKAEE